MSWDLRFLALARNISEWSKDPSTKVGAVIIKPDRTVVSLGYNGFPRGVKDTGPRLEDRESKLRCTIHAEENAILSATQSLKGCFLYSTHFPCCACSARIIQVGITQVHSSVQAAYEERWKEDVEIGKSMLQEAKVRYFRYYV